MSKKLQVPAIAVLLLGLATVAAADSHQQAPVYVWVSFVKAQPGQGDALIGLLMEDAAIYDPLVESGAALEWGIGIPVVHSGGDSPVRVQWVTFVGWAGADKFMGRFMERMQGMSADERKAMGEKWSSIVEPGSHSDMINRTVHVGSGRLVRPTYIHIDYRTAKPGKEMAATAFYKSHVAPVYDQLVADGKILNYGLHMPAVERGQGWTHMGWFMSSDLAARDAVSGAMAAMSEEAWKKLMTGAQEVLEYGHEQQIIMVVHHKTAAGGQEGED